MAKKCEHRWTVGINITPKGAYKRIVCSRCGVEAK